MKSTLARKPSDVFSSLDLFCEELKKQGFAIKFTPSSQLAKNWLELENPLPSTYAAPSCKDFCYHSKKLAPSEGWGLVMRDSKSCAETAANEIVLDYPEAAMDFLIRKLAHSEWVGDEKNYVNEYKLRAEAGVVVGPFCEFGENVILEAGVRVGARVKIGKNTRIGAGSRIADDSVIGDGCYFRGPVSIGGHGFGFTVYPGAPVARHRLHVGSVMIADGVQLGSFVCVDRGVFEDTVIGARSATDNLVQIAHNVKIGKHAVLCGFVSLSGSTILGDYVTFGGLVVSKGHLTVGNRVSIGAFSAITRDVPDDSQLRGVPVRPIKRDLRIMAIQEKLPEIYSQLKGFLKRGYEVTVISKGISEDVSKDNSLDQAKIHPTAIVESGVELGADVEVGPYSYIRSGAKIGARTKIHSHVNIWGESEIGEDNEFYPYCVVGAPPQILGSPNPQGRAIIGNKNIFRESVQIHRGSSRENNETRVGNENYIMTSVHIAHDCVIGTKVVVATKTGLAGHSKIHDSAIVSGACGVSQHVRIGTFTFCAGMTRFQRDLPPFMCAKEFCEVTGPNIVGMKRAGFSEGDIRVAKEIYKALFVNKGLLKAQLQNLQERFAGQPVFETFNTFLEGTKVGIMRNG